jgi:hypothetical protein
MTAINGSGKYVHTEWMINIYVYWLSQTALRTASANTRFVHYAVFMSMRGVMQVSHFFQKTFEGKAWQNSLQMSTINVTNSIICFTNISVGSLVECT